MKPLFDYLRWRGDLSFTEAPFNEVDSLIFALISYVDFANVVSPLHDAGEELPLRTVANTFFARHPDEKRISIGLIIPKDIVKLLKAAKETRRFRSVGVRAYVNEIDDVREMQFSAMTFLPGDGTAVAAFRGTDDTIIGWKENFNMSFLLSVPAQEEAAAYLNLVADHFSGNLRVTGHSKGGNLSVYAAVHCRRDVRARLIEAYSNDGPGFSQSLLNDPDYFEIRPKIKTFLPQSSLVGMLLEHDENYTVVKSRQTGVFQHDGLTWEVMGGSFVHLPSVTVGCKRTDRTVNQWIREMTPAQREQMSSAIYRMLSSDHAETLTDLASLKNKWLIRSRNLDPEVRKIVSQMLTKLIKLNAKNILGDILNKEKR